MRHALATRATRDDEPISHRQIVRSAQSLLIVLALCNFIIGGCGKSETDSQAHPERASHNSQLASKRAPRAHPNLVLITLDTTRADALGAYGQSRPTTPDFDRLAAEGVLFEQAATSNPETLPAHATLFTGRWPYTHGVRSNAGYELAERNTTLAQVLRSRGYVTAAEIAARVLRKETRITRGFDHYRDPQSQGVTLKVVRILGGATPTSTFPTRVAADITDSGIRLLRRFADDPFFIWLHYFDAHDPYSAPPAFNRKIPDSTYHAEVASADYEMGRFIAEIERLGLRDDTLVVITSDHGEALGEHGEPSHSFLVYDTTIHVPLLFWGPASLQSGKRIESLVRTVDVMPTLLDFMRIPALPGIEGVSLVPVMDGRETDLHLTAYGEATRFSTTFDMPVIRYLREGRWKYIHKVNPELYDVISDPGESHDLSSERPDIVERLRASLTERIAAAPSASHPAAVPLDAQTAAELEALGYAAVHPAPASLAALDSLELRGPDPASKIRETRLISEAQGLLDHDEFSEALVRLEQVRKRNPKSVYVLSLMVRGQLGLGEQTAAISSLRALIALEPCDEDRLAKLGELLRAASRYEDLLAAHRQGATACPELTENLNNYAWVLATLPQAELRDGEQAVRTISRAIDQLDEPSFAYLDTLAVAHAETGHFEAALDAITRALTDARASQQSPQMIQLLEAHRDTIRRNKPIRDPDGSGA